MTENELKIGAIEGNSFSGKTTLVKELETEYGFSVVWEPSAYVSSFPSFPPDSYAQAKKAIDVFADVEKRRSTDAIDLTERSNHIVMDRSLWTYPAFQYVVMKRMPNIPNSYLYSLDVLQKHIDNREIIAPGAVVSLIPKSQEEFEKRVRERGRVGIEFLNDWETTIMMERLFGTVINCVYTKNNGRTTISSNNIKEIAAETNQFLRQSSYFADAILAFDQLRVLK